MAHGNKIIGMLIWMGFYAKGVENHRRLYKESPKEEYISFLSSLYSGRWHERYRTELLNEIPGLELVAARSVFEYHSELSEALDRADVISTIFEWASRQDSLHKATRSHLLSRAESVVEDALHYVGQLPVDKAHTHALLLLTRARVFLALSEATKKNTPQYAQEARERAEMDIIKARMLACLVDNAYQRERIHRKAGMLYRLLGHPWKGFKSGLRALVVLHPAPGVKAKTLVALAGIDL